MLDLLCNKEYNVLSARGGRGRLCLGVWGVGSEARARPT